MISIREEVEKLIRELCSVESRKTVLLTRSNGKSIEDIAKEFCVTRERIRQIEAKYERKFAVWYSKTRIVERIIDDSNLPLSHDVLKAYFGNYYSEMMYLLRLYKKSVYYSGTQLDAPFFSEI